jgi:hypothetical protein
MAFPPGPTNAEEWRAAHTYQGKDETMINQSDPRMTDASQSRETGNLGVTDAIMRSATTDGSYTESRQASYVDLTGYWVEDPGEDQDRNLDRENIRYGIAIVIHALFGALEIILALYFLFRFLERRSSRAVPGYSVLKTDAHL